MEGMQNTANVFYSENNLQDLDGGYGEGGDTTITNNYSGKMRIIGFYDYPAEE